MLYFFPQSQLPRIQTTKETNSLGFLVPATSISNAMEMKNSCIGTLLLFLLLVAVPAFSIGRLHAENIGTEIYDIDYRGPETHTYIPPPNRAGPRPRIHYQTSMARRRSKLRNDRPNGKKN